MHLSSSLKHDEAERGIYVITHALMRAGHESIVIGAAHEEEELVTRLTRDDTVYYQLPMPKKSWCKIDRGRQFTCDQFFVNKGFQGFSQFILTKVTQFLDLLQNQDQIIVIDYLETTFIGCFVSYQSK